MMVNTDTEDSVACTARRHHRAVCDEVAPQAAATDAVAVVDMTCDDATQPSSINTEHRHRLVIDDCYVFTMLLSFTYTPRDRPEISLLPAMPWKTNQCENYHITIRLL